MKKTKNLLSLIAFVATLTLTGCGTADISSSASTNSTASSISSSSDSALSSSSETDKEMEGTGTQVDPYLPLTAKHLKSLQDKIVGSTSVYISLSNDIDLKNEEWSPLCQTETKIADIVLIGNNHTIKGLKITASTEDTTGVYGLFGYATGRISDLTVEGNIDVTSMNDLSLAGLVCGYAANLSLNNVKAVGDVTISDDASTVNQGSYVGGMVGFYSCIKAKYITVQGCSFKGSVVSSSDYIGIAGGLIGGSDTNTSSLGICALNTNYVEATDVTGTVIAGGLIGSSNYYFSAVNNVVVADKIETTGAFSADAYAGGIVGSDYYENAILYNIAKVGKVISGKAATKGNAGKIVSSIFADGYKENENIKGDAVVGNVSIATTVTGANTLAPADTDITTLTTAGLQAMGFVSGAWTLKDGELPVLKENAGDALLDKTQTATIKAGYEGGKDDQYSFTAGYINDFDNKVTRKGYNLIGASYTEDSYVAYRWYAPLNVAPTLYNFWFDASTITGYWKGADTYNFVINIVDDGTFVAYFDDSATAKGSWWCDGSYFIFTVDYDTAPYEDQVAIFQTDGTFTFPDANADEYVYKYTKQALDFGYWGDDDGHVLFLNGDGTGTYTDGGSLINVTYKFKDNVITDITVGNYYSPATPTFKDGAMSLTLDDGDSPFTLTLTKKNGIPDYTNWSCVGNYSGIKYNIKLTNDGNFNAYKVGSTNLYAQGGYRAYGSKTGNASLTMKCTGISLNANYNYNSTKDVLVKNDGSDIYAKTGTYQKTFKTSNSSVYIYQFSDANYLVINGKLDTKTAITGTLTEGATIQIGTSSYTITNGVLVFNDPAPDVTPLVNTYEASIGSTKITLVLNADKTGTYNGSAITYAYDGTKITFTLDKATFSLTWNSTDKTLIGTKTEGETTTNLSFAVKKEEEETKNATGNWTGTFMGNTWKLAVKSDGTCTLTLPAAAIDGTWSGTLTGTINISCGDYRGSCVYSSTNDTLKANLEDSDYNSYSVEFSRAA
ncbi:MAG: hypothetical protein WCR56_02065 [Bacilli bacterium]